MKTSKQRLAATMFAVLVMVSGVLPVLATSPTVKVLATAASLNGDGLVASIFGFFSVFSAAALFAPGFVAFA